MKITDYCVCSNTCSDELSQEIFHLISQGWQPYGGLVADFDDDGSLYVQAMVKYEVQQLRCISPMKCDHESGGLCESLAPCNYKREVKDDER